VIVRMRTSEQGARVANAANGVQLPGNRAKNGTPGLSRFVDVGVDFEKHRAAVESVSVLFELYSGDAEGFIATGQPGEPMP
jgi:putative transposase